MITEDLKYNNNKIPLLSVSKYYERKTIYSYTIVVGNKTFDIYTL